MASRKLFWLVALLLASAVGVKLVSATFPGGDSDEEMGEGDTPAGGSPARDSPAPESPAPSTPAEEEAEEAEEGKKSFVVVNA